MARFRVALSANTNPDFPRGSHEGSVSLPLTYEHVDTLQEASAAVRRYLDTNDLGSGNWTGGDVTDETGAVVARVSYNGRLWNPDGTARAEGETDPAPVTPRELAESMLQGPVYAPPYEGALQDEFAWHLVKYLREDATLRSDVQVSIPGALFAVDFVVELPAADGTVRRVAFECGGARGLRDHQRQARRDAALIASGEVSVVYRLRGSDLLHHMEDCLYIVGNWEASGDRPGLFSSKGTHNLGILASPEAKLPRVRPEQDSVMVAYEVGSEGDPSRALWHAANGTTPFILLRRFDAAYPDVWEPLVQPPAPDPPYDYAAADRINEAEMWGDAGRPDARRVL